MILNLKNKRAHQIDTITTIINKPNANQIKSHRDEYPLERDSRQLKSTRVNSNNLSKKATNSAVSTMIGANTGSHTNMGAHFSYNKDGQFDRQETCLQNSGGQVQHELNRIVNAYKRIKKYEVGDNSLLQEHSLALKETSKEGKDKEIDRNSAHKSQKISHKRQLINKTHNNYILVTEHIDHEKEEKCNSGERLSSQALLQKTLDSFIFLFDSGRTVETTKEASARGKTHRQDSKAHTKDLKHQTQGRQYSKDSKRPQILIQGMEDASIIHQSSKELKIEEFLRRFESKLNFLDPQPTPSSTSYKSKHSSNSVRPPYEIKTSLPHVLCKIKQFTGELVQKLLQQQARRVEQQTKTLQQLAVEMEQNKKKFAQLEEELSRERQQNSATIENLMQMQQKSMNSIIILNELSLKFDLQNFIRTHFTQTESQPSMQQSICFVKCKQVDEINETDSMYEIATALPKKQLKKSPKHMKGEKTRQLSGNSTGIRLANQYIVANNYVNIN